MGKWVDYYCADNNRELIKLVDKILSKNFGWLPQKDYDDFYSLAGQVVWDCERKYNQNNGTRFKTYFVNCLQRKIKTRITYINRQKRNSGSFDLSMESLIDAENELTIESVLATKEDVEISPLSQRYLDSLSSLQRKVAELIMNGYNNEEIKRALSLSNDRFNAVCKRMKDRKKTRVFDGIGGIRA